MLTCFVSRERSMVPSSFTQEHTSMSGWVGCRMRIWCKAYPISDASVGADMVDMMELTPFKTESMV
ncbi:hypothetical protein KSB_44300 [Ktedonobacter robiniae]|uniref:Uncharacterized protein n=1 Tax=Ktedonobacter robiniae TaxID=2778365 RepID=A0ABQ3UU51_9CHLR|nr:hypothetical protein KSB_44300 [Ktedonobacter robiniae]